MAEKVCQPNARYISLVLFTTCGLEECPLKPVWKTTAALTVGISMIILLPSCTAASGTDALSAKLWGLPVLLFMAAAGLYLTMRTGCIQFTRFGHIMRATVGKLLRRQSAGAGEITPFQALSTAMAGTIGTGSISGVVAAVTMGGPGALFWLWIMAVLGMATKYAEVVLSIRYRQRSSNGEWTGGPMYYIQNGMGRRWRWLAVVFCTAGALASFGIGNAVQVSCITDAVSHLTQSLHAISGKTSNAINWTVGIATAGITGFTILGGIKRLGNVTGRLVPVMSLVYVASCLAVIFTNWREIGAVLTLIFRSAFSPAAIIGGTAGHALKTCIMWGVRRGIFTNEAGLGSAPMAHATSSETNAVRQGFYGVFEVFADSMILCTLTGFAVLCCDAGQADYTLCYGVCGTGSDVTRAFATVLGEHAAGIIVALCIVLFALSTLLGWALYGSRCCAYLLGARSVRPFQLLFSGFCIVGALVEAELIWGLADILNALMALPNLIAVLALSGTVAKATSAYFARLDKRALCCRQVADRHSF